MLLEVHFDPSFSSLEVLDIPDVTQTLVTGLPPGVYCIFLHTELRHCTGLC